MADERRLYEIADALQSAISRHVDSETGEVSEEGLAEIEALEGDSRERALEIALYIKGLRQEAAGPNGIAAQIVADAKALAERYLLDARKLERQADGLARYLAENLKRSNLWASELKDERVRVHYSKSQAAIVLDGQEHLVPRRFRLDPKPPQPGLKLLLDAMKATDVEELSLGKGATLQVYAVRDRRITLKIS